MYIFLLVLVLIVQLLILKVIVSKADLGLVKKSFKEIQELRKEQIRKVIRKMTDKDNL